MVLAELVTVTWVTPAGIAPVPVPSAFAVRAADLNAYPVTLPVTLPAMSASMPASVTFKTVAPVSLRKKIK